jgi:uncharacterized protein (TIGR03083 family)
MDVWPLIAAERGRLADFLGNLESAHWQSKSLCDGWTVHDVVAHVVVTAEMTPPKFLSGLAGSGFRFHRMSASNVERLRGEPRERLVQRLRDSTGSRVHPPGPAAAMLLEIVVHGEDIAVPLGATIAHTPEGLIGAADFGKNSQPLVGCKKRIAGLTLRATDVDWSTGDGPEVSGPIRALLSAMAGRHAVLDSLTGDGVAVLRDRP